MQPSTAYFFCCCCYWDGIVRYFFYFFCTQLSEHVIFFLIHFFADETWLPTKKKIMPSHICRINFHIRSEKPDTQVGKDRLTNRTVAIKLVKDTKPKERHNSLHRMNDDNFLIKRLNKQNIILTYLPR